MGHQHQRDRRNERPAAKGDHPVPELGLQPRGMDTLDPGEPPAERNGSTGEERKEQDYE